MYESLQAVLNNPGFMPHGHCFLWTPKLLWLFVIGDGLTVLAYYSIPVALWYFARKRPDFGYNWLLVLFGVFIFACGTSHLIKIWDIWNYAYWAEAYVTAFTGVVSMIVAIAVWPAIPRLLAIPGSARLELALDELRDKHEALQSSETKYRLLIETASEGVWVTNTDGSTQFANRKMCEMLGCETLEGTHVEDFVFEKDKAAVSTTLERHSRDIGERYEFTFRRRDGSAIHTIVSAQPTPGRTGEITSILGVITDITDRVQAEQKLEQLNRELEERVARRTSTIAEVNETLQLAVKTQEATAEELRNSNAQLHRSIEAIERQSRFVSGLNELNEILGVCVSHEEVRDAVCIFVSRYLGAVGGALHVRVDAGYERVKNAWGNHAEFREFWTNDACWAERTGKAYAFGGPHSDAHCAHCQPSPGYYIHCLPLVNREGCIGVLSLVLEHDAVVDPVVPDSGESENLRALREQLTTALNGLEMRTRLQQLALHDSLTGAYNRTYLVEQLGREALLAQRSGKMLAIAFIDIDHFKSVNDQHGHEAGDLVLKHFVEAAASRTRKTDVFGRYGGEEFLLVMPDCDVESAMQRVEEVRDAVAQMYFEEPLLKNFHLTFTVGIAIMPRHGRSPTELLAAADSAMYRGKQARNCTIVADSH
ncbi:MAG TPA: diguanylate cyclase [Rhodocyclaceae bacterium]|nr:diguanylate cyclase [Rhodocyclaceae bacterium]